MPEEEAFCVFVKLMQDYRLRELFKPSMAELGLCMYQFECMIQVRTSHSTHTRCKSNEYFERLTEMFYVSGYYRTLQEHLPELHMHFQAQSFHTSMYASSWFLTIFLTSFPLAVATRIFDIFMCEVSIQAPRPLSPALNWYHVFTQRCQCTESVYFCIFVILRNMPTFDISVHSLEGTVSGL